MAHQIVQVLDDRIGSVELLEGLIHRRTATIGVIGLGYVGLPLAVELAGVYARVIGCDMDAHRVGEILAGRSHITDVSSEAVAEAVAAKRLEASTEFSVLGQCDVIIICVPTPLNKSKDPDLSYIRHATESIARSIRPGQLVVLESTTYPGTTDELILPMLEEQGLALDADFLLAFSPERVDPGSSFQLRDIPKVVGGCSERSTAAACDLYSAIVASVHPVSSARVAETVKLLENTFRLVNIGLANEFAMMCRHLGIDSGEVITAAATKPFGFMPFYPGPGAGGHCIPLDPLYLSWRAEQQGFVPRFIELADQVNSKMPDHVVELITEALNGHSKSIRDAKILTVGVAYKNDIEDTRQSAAIAIIDRLRARGAFVAYHDPLVPELDFDFHDRPEWRSVVRPGVERRAPRVADSRAFSRRRRYDVLKSIEISPEILGQADCVVILAKHKVIDYAQIARHTALIIDTRGAIDATAQTGARAQIIRL